MDRWRGRVAVVTGASAGIGAAIAYQLQDVGVHVVALARREDKIPAAIQKAREEATIRGRKVTNKASTPGTLISLKCDLSKEEDIVNAFQYVKENTNGISILINNAGVPAATPLTETNTKEWREVLDINVLGLSICTREAIQQMKANSIDDGHIVHISSVAGHIMPVLPRQSMYFASKHAVRVLTDGLRKELAAEKSKIRVTEVSPGFVKTEIADRFKDLIDVEEYWKRPHLKPEDVADAVLYALGVPQDVQIHEIILRHTEDS